MVGRFHGMLVLSATCSKPPGRWEDFIRMAIRRTIQSPGHTVRCNGWMSSDFCERPVNTSPIGKNILSGIFLGYALHAGGIWKGDMIPEIEELENMDASEIFLRRINAKEVSITLKGEEFIFPVADGTAKLSG